MRVVRLSTANISSSERAVLATMRAIMSQTLKKVRASIAKISVQYISVIVDRYLR